MAWRQHAAIRSHGEHFPVDKTIGTPPPRKEFPLHACAAPLGLLWLMLQRIDAITKDESTMPQRHSH